MEHVTDPARRPAHQDGPRPLHHLALAGEWAAAVAGDGWYRRSTRGLGLDEVGFVHCAFADQVPGVADRYYRGAGEVVLLTIDPARLASPVRLEAAEAGGEAFPHLYGPLPVDAVVAVERLTV
jgi:glutathione S-transferase